MSTYNTNLAAEFWVLSMLHRLGVDATLTLGNKKAVDIVITDDRAGHKTVDVKGLQKRYDWPADNIRQSAPGDHFEHFYVFLTFDGKIKDPDYAPSVWIVPANEVGRFVRCYKTRTVVSRAALVRDGTQYKQAWSLLVEGSAA
jgi:hypothetical protein